MKSCPADEEGRLKTNGRVSESFNISSYYVSKVIHAFLIFQHLVNRGTYTAMYIHRLTDECTGLCSSVEDIFLGFGTEEYISYISREEYKSIEECTLFSCRGGTSHVFKSSD
jgi:hypothetical protein